MCVVIRKYEKKDQAALLDVWYRASLVAHPFLPSVFLDQERQDIPSKYLPHAETWIYEEGGEVRGFIALLGNVVGAIFVCPQHHGQGIGRALMDHARNSRDELELEVFEENRLGRGFYAKYGFESVGRRVHETTGYPLLQLLLKCRGSV